MSEVIEAYIRRHPGVAEKEAFEGFLQEGRIRTWVGSDESRKERLRKEFERVWATMNGGEASTARAGPSGPQQAALEHRPAPVVEAPPQPMPAPTPPQPARVGKKDKTAVPVGRRLQVLCTNCRRLDVWVDDHHNIQCRNCSRVFDDMLQLIRVTPVGPFEFFFGDGWKGVATAVGLGAGLVGLYYLLRGF